MTHLCTAWPTSVAEEAYWQAIRKQYMIAPDEIYLNTGSFGSQPRPVFEKMLEIIEDVERNPTRDQACFSAVGVAVEFQEAIGKDRIRERGRQLAAYLRGRLAETGWAKQLTPSAEDLSGSISAFHLSGFDTLDLYDRYRITVPTAKSDGVYWIRVSTHICNGFDHVDRLIDALHEQRNE